MLNAFSGKAYMVATGGFTTPPSYAAGTGFVLLGTAAGTGTSVKTLGINSTLEIIAKASAKWNDGTMNDTVASEEVTGKLNVAMNAADYAVLTAALQGVECELRVADNDCDVMAQVVGIYPHFAPTTKIGEVQYAEVTFSYKQASNISAEKKKYRIVSLTQA